MNGISIYYVHSVFTPINTNTHMSRYLLTLVEVPTHFGTDRIHASHFFFSYAISMINGQKHTHLVTICHP